MEQSLFSPINIGSLELRNRFVMPAMQRFMARDFEPTAEMAGNYRLRAEGGVALIIAENSDVAHPSADWKSFFCRITPKTLAGWRLLIDSVKGTGAKFFAQIGHPGAIRTVPADSPWAHQDTLSPSGMVKGDRPNGRPMTRAEMLEIQQSFITAALLVQQLGGDGIELHGGHGGLLDQFMWADTNLRTDGYGGPDIEARLRFPVELIAAVRGAVGPDFPISLRISQWKEVDYEARTFATPADLGFALRVLRHAGVDIFHASTRRFYRPAWPNSPLTFAAWVKALSNAPVIAVGSVGLSTDVMEDLFNGNDPMSRIEQSVARLESGFDNGEFDLIAVGRSLIADPQWVEKVRRRAFDEIPTFNRAMLGEDLGRETDVYADELRQHASGA